MPTWDEAQPTPGITVDMVDEVPKKQSGRKASTFYSDIAVKARQNPAQWVVLRGYKTSAPATQMRQGKYPAIDPRDYEIECRRNPDGVRFDLYLKYVGKIVE